MDVLLHIFNLSWILHSFSSIWKTSSIIPIHKRGKPLDSPAWFQPISLTHCIRNLFECIIPSRLLFFLESNSILSPRHASLCPGQFTLDQILYISQSILDEFNKPTQGSRTILFTIYQPNFLLLGSCLRFYPTPTFLGVTFDYTLFFSKHVSSLKVKFFPRLKALRCIYASPWGPSKEFLSLLYKVFLRPLLTYASLGSFPFLSVTNFTKRLVATSPAPSCPPHFTSSL